MGCLEEFEERLTLIKLQSTDDLLLIGDLIDHGPDSAGVEKKCAQLPQICSGTFILGNHKEKLLRYIHPVMNKLWVPLKGLAVKTGGFLTPRITRAIF